jgi:hypothetical protein
MKKAFSLIAILTALFVSCDESELEVHQTYFTPAKPNGIQVYADQTKDSIRVISYDSWTASTNFAGEPWFTISPTNCNFKAGSQISDTRIDLTITPNTTGVVRSGSILVNSYFSIGMNVNQLHWLNITNPVGRMITIDENGDELSKEQQYCVFERNTIAEQHNFEVAFTTYSELATLESDVDWLTFESEEFTAGSHTLIITCKANPTIEKRVGTLKLASNGVSNSIVITQERKKDL